MFSRNVPMVPTKEQYGPGSEAESKPLPGRKKDIMKKTAAQLADEALQRRARNRARLGGILGRVVVGVPATLAGTVYGSTLGSHLLDRNSKHPVRGTVGSVLGSVLGAGLGIGLGHGVGSGLGGMLGYHGAIADSDWEPDELDEPEKTGGFMKKTAAQLADQVLVKLANESSPPWLPQ